VALLLLSQGELKIQRALDVFVEYFQVDPLQLGVGRGFFSCLLAGLDVDGQLKKKPLTTAVLAHHTMS
jgi:hypothetical protein